ncbi:hypothetical protein CKO31_22285 [Thiohalocapsa halophila]|uniref:Uncharacterized protein n=1 Tax=Thiohalocapsa halophila TaxID=69359 RepID=A0ABS1CND7_9GAMM|nr:hypothetical protein [Thiohalocapsa halophila]MBK1633426.1 hypothetical protein [Thiohalocapsa halophila]
MDLPFNHRPGRRERHLRRRHMNALFAWPPEEVPPEQLLEAQRLDHEELEAFQASFRQLVERAADLPPDAGSDPVLELKADLERHYDQASGLPEDQTEAKQALAKLIEVIMRTLLRHVGDDPTAQQELADEAAAREIHFRLLEQPLVADLLHPESPIRPQDLTPSLLSADDPEFAAACEVFDGPQLAVIVDEAEALHRRLSERGADVGDLRPRLEHLRQVLADAGGPGHSH